MDDFSSKLPMIKTIEVKDIKPNPFNARIDYDDKSINELAKEIEKVGFWSGSLRGRIQNGKIELCFGHRRLAAVKKLGRKEVSVDVVDLSDEEMAEQGLIENLQRQGLNDMEKAEGIKRLVGLYSKNGSKEAAYEKIRVMLGYESSGWIKTFAGIAEYSSPVKKLISEKKITGKAAIVAHQFGGAEMVKTAAKHKLPHDTIGELSKAIREIPDDKIQAKLKAKVIAGEIREPKEIEKKAEPMLRAKAEKGKPPPDLIIVIARWTDSIVDWRKSLREVIPYRDYLDTSPKITKEFREEVRALISDLEKLL